MKIIDVKLSDPVYIPFRQMTDAINALSTAMTYTFLQVFTDEDVTGIGLGPFFGGGGTEQSTHRGLVEAPGYR